MPDHNIGSGHDRVSKILYRKNICQRGGRGKLAEEQGGVIDVRTAEEGFICFFVNEKKGVLSRSKIWMNIEVVEIIDVDKGEKNTSELLIKIWIRCIR